MLSIPLIQFDNPIQNCIAQPSNGVSSQYYIAPSNINCYVPYVSCPVCSVCIPKMDGNVPILNQNSTQDFPQQIMDHLKVIISNLQEKDFEKQKQELLFWVNNINASKDSSSLNKKKKRIHFTQFEDDKIKELVDRYGTNNWPLVSTFIHGHTPKQCRDRYFNYLMPAIFHGEWTKEEDEMLMKLYKEYGSKWTIIQNQSKTGGIFFSIRGMKKKIINLIILFLKMKKNHQKKLVSLIKIQMKQMVRFLNQIFFRKSILMIGSY